MRDPQINEFRKRLHKIDEIHQAGGAFEATGALGRSYFDSMRPKARRSIPLRGIALVLAGMLLVKGAMLAQVGAENYQARVERLGGGNVVEKLGSWVMHADPVTRKIASYIRPMIL